MFKLLYRPVKEILTRLSSLLRRGNRTVPNEDPAALANLERVANLLEALPLTAGEMCYYRNTLASCRNLAARGEWGALRYQLREMERKVQRLRDAIA